MTSRSGARDKASPKKNIVFRPEFDKGALFVTIIIMTNIEHIALWLDDVIFLKIRKAKKHVCAGRETKFFVGVAWLNVSKQLSV